MENWITEFMNDFGYIGIFLLIALENIFPPIPSEVILTFGGFMTTTANMTIHRCRDCFDTGVSGRSGRPLWGWFTS